MRATRLGKREEGGSSYAYLRRLDKQMKDLAEDNFTNEVLATFEDAESERFKEIMQSLIRHLHTFVREVQLTEEEWFEAIRFLTRTGQISDDNRQEFILLSDTLGVSMQMIGVNHSKPSGATESTVVGPFYVEDAPECKNGDDLANGAPGEPCFVEGQVRSVSGGPIANAHLEVWQADDEGFYDVQREGLSGVQNRGQLTADENGRFWFWTVKPASYPIPHDGPVGGMLKAAKRTPWRPAHIHFKVWAPGYETVITHVFEKGDKYLGSDAVFGVKDSLIADFARHRPETTPDGTEMDKPFYTLRYDFLLAPRV
jgi:hydroxyquinol 1,2-dioxygenase